MIWPQGSVASEGCVTMPIALATPSLGSLNMTWAVPCHAISKSCYKHHTRWVKWCIHFWAWEILLQVPQEKLWANACASHYKTLTISTEKCLPIFRNVARITDKSMLLSNPKWVVHFFLNACGVLRITVVNVFLLRYKDQGLELLPPWTSQQRRQKTSVRKPWRNPIPCSV